MRGRRRIIAGEHGIFGAMDVRAGATKKRDGEEASATVRPSIPAKIEPLAIAEASA